MVSMFILWLYFTNLLKKLDAIRYVSFIILVYSMFCFHFSSYGEPAPRKELLHNIDPFYNPSGEPLANSTFNTTTRAALRFNEWKIITGDPGLYCAIWWILNYNTSLWMHAFYWSILWNELKKNQLVAWSLKSAFMLCIVSIDTKKLTVFWKIKLSPVR